MIRHLSLGLALFAATLTVSLAAAQSEPTRAQLARSNGSLPSVPVLRDEECTYERLKTLLESKSHVDRLTAACNLRHGTHERADELTLLALQDSYYAVRCQAAMFAASRGKLAVGVISALVAALDSEEPLVRAEVVIALQRTGGVDNALPQLYGMLANEDQPLPVADALAESDAGRKMLAELTASRNATIRLFSNAGLIKAGGQPAPAATEPYLRDLRTLLENPDAPTLIQACRSVELTTSSAAGAGRPLAALLVHTNIAVRNAAADAILQSAPHDDDVVSAILPALDDKEIRVKCIIALGRIGQHARPALPTLIRLMQEDYACRFAVLTYALPGIDPQAKDALAPLLKLLQTSVAENQADEHVIVALGGYGPAAKDAVSDLIKIMGIRSKHGYHISAAIWTLGQIGPDAAAAQPEIEKHLRGLSSDLAATALARIAPQDPDRIPPPQQKYPGGKY